MTTQNPPRFTPVPQANSRLFPMVLGNDWATAPATARDINGLQASSSYANRVSLAGHDVYPQLSGLCRFSGTARGSGRLRTHSARRPISQYGIGAPFFLKMSNFKRAREGSNCYCVEVQFHLFWLRREGIHESYA